MQKSILTLLDQLPDSRSSCYHELNDFEIAATAYLVWQDESEIVSSVSEGPGLLW